MQKGQKVLTFHDLMSHIETSGGSPKVVEMNTSDFTIWDKRLTGGKTVHVPYLKDIAEARFLRNSVKLYYKTSHEDTQFEEVDFLMKKAARDIEGGTNNPKQRETPRGIPTWKKKGIVANLVKLMNEVKRPFWNELLTDDKSRDLQKDNTEAADFDM